MGKTILERMYGVAQKMQNPNINGQILINATTLKKAGTDLKGLRQELNMTDMQVLILMAILQKSSRYRIDGDDVASFLGMEYLKFLSRDDDMKELRKRGYIRIDKDGHINIPKDTLKTLKGNKAVEPEPTTGLTTGRILNRINKLLEIRDDDEMTTEELFDSIRDIIKDNPDTSISRACEKYIQHLEWDETVAFFVLIYYYWFLKYDMLGWHDMEDYFDEDELDNLREQYTLEILSLQQRKVIEYTGRSGLMDKEYFHIKDEIKEEIFSDLGGMRKKEVKVSASKKLLAGQIGAKELFYNPSEERQVAQLKALMSAERLDAIRTAMKEKGMRSGAWQYDKFMATKKQPNLKRTYQEGSVDGYIRGHLCPSNDRMRPGMNEQTFYFTNMAPQDPYLNGGLWAWLEEHVQHLALEAGKAWVVTGCIDTDQSNWVTDVVGKPIAVPEAFFKAVLLRYRDDADGGEHYEARAWVVDNGAMASLGLSRRPRHSR